MNEDIKIPSLEERIQLAWEAVEEMDKRDKTGLALVDIMKPSQWLYNLLIIKAEYDKFERKRENEYNR